jgi:hypothetical protein
MRRIYATTTKKNSSHLAQVDTTSSYTHVAGPGGFLTGAMHDLKKL